MADIDVRSYRAIWSTQTRRGRIVLGGLTPGGRGVVAVTHEVSVEDASEMHMLVDLLRNEKPVYFDRGTQSFETTKEPIGEGEGKS
jgi:hypothetical protein